MNIVMMYKGDTCDYLQWTLAQARDASKSHRVICISDRDWGVGGVEYYDWDYYAEGTKWLEDLPEMPEDDVFHRRSFVRPAILRNFCQDKGIDRVFNADADVIIACDLDDVCKQWADCDFTISGFPFGHVNHSVATMKSIDAYLDWCRNRGKDMKGVGCDMASWSLFVSKTNLSWVDTSKVLDHNIGTELDVYEDENGHKRIVFVDGKPHKVRRDNGDMERLLVIHAWSGLKMWIGTWCQQIRN